MIVKKSAKGIGGVVVEREGEGRRGRERERGTSNSGDAIEAVHC